MSFLSSQRLTLAFALGLLSLAAAHAAPFEIAVSPSRFELSAKPGGRLGQSLEIRNVGTESGEVSLRTLDWTYSDQGAIAYSEPLAPGSCRPWVALERRTLRVAARSRAMFRFQVDVPPDAPRSECRFMLAVESAQPAYTGQITGGGASVALPVSGRIAIAVYIAINGAEPKLEVTDLGMGEVQGKRTALITVMNKGDAHGRLEGGLETEDANGQKFELVPDGSPVMPGQTRVLALMPRAQTGETLKEPKYPLRSSGRLDWENGSFKIEKEFK